MIRWFVTGTDTGIGKTHVACALARELAGRGKQVAALKPVASGCAASAEGLRNDDALALMAACNVALDYATVNPYAFEPAIAPHIAAAEAGVVIDAASIGAIADRVTADWLLVEGAGGWCVPLGPGIGMADLARAVAADVLLVVGLRLGCINHALLSARQIERDGFRLAGWVANVLDPAMPRLDDNIAAITAGLQSAPLAVVPHGPAGTAAIDWSQIRRDDAQYLGNGLH